MLQCDTSAPQNLCGVNTFFNPNSEFVTGGQRLLLVGQMLATGSATANIPMQVFTDEATLFGEGSMVSSMVASARQQALFSEIWALPLVDFGTMGSAEVTFSNAASMTVADVIYLVANGEVYSIAAAPGDTDEMIAAAFALVIDDPSLTVTVAGDQLTLTTKNGGAVGGYLDVRTSYSRLRITEPKEVGVAVVMTASVGVPDLEAALSGLGTEPFVFIAQPYHDTVAMVAFDEYLCGTWSPRDRRRSEGYTAIDAPHATAQALAASLNSPHIKMFPRENFLRPEYATTAALAADGYSYLNTGREPLAVSEPLYGHVLTGEPAPEITDSIGYNDLDVLIGYGLSPLRVNATGEVELSSFRTSYLLNAAGVEDYSLRGGNTIAQLRFVAEYIEDRVWSTFSGHSIRDDSYTPRAGQKVTTRRRIRAFVQGLGYTLSDLNVIEDPEGFADLVMVNPAQNAGGCIDISISPDLVNQLCCINLFINSKL